MSKHYILLKLVTLGFITSINAQITITNATFPAVGDTLRYAFDFNPPSNNYITPPGGNQNWNFSNLNAELTTTTVFRSPNAGMQVANFPGSELLVIAATGESYYNVTNNRVELLGYAGDDPLNLGVKVLAKYAPPIVDRRAPLNFFDINQQSSGLLLPFSVEDLPDTLVQRLPIRPDSLRIRLSINRLEVVDAWGNLSIPGGSYEVLREKRTTYRETRLDAKVPPLGWLDITDIALQSLGLNNLGVDTTTTHHFFSNESKETIAILTLNNDGAQVTNVQYKANQIATDITSVEAIKPAMTAFPNPATDQLYLNFTDIQPGQYHLKFYNLLGMEVLSKTYQIPGKQFETELNISRLGAGTYLYSLHDNRGIPLITKRLIIVKS